MAMLKRSLGILYNRFVEPQARDISDERDLLEAILETAEILADPDAIEMLQKSLADIQASRVIDHADVVRELG